MVLAIIPARYDSGRLPGKALADIGGKPMVVRVWERARRAEGVDEVWVATDDDRIAAAVEAEGGAVARTGPCASGTDRVAAALGRRRGVRVVVNVQGDEPLIDPEGISRVASHLREHPEDSVVTLAADAEPGDLETPSVVKAVLDRRGYALYFSRAPIPFPRQAGGARPLRHLGIYGYRRDTLLELARLEPTPLERSESLEQLRALENGISIRVLTGARPSWGVDTPADAAAAAERLAGAPFPGGG